MTDMTSEIISKSLQEQVLDRIREAILEGRYAAGEPLRIDALASQLGVSHMPVREALHILTMEGLAVRQPRRGVVVSRIDDGDVDQAYRTLAALEAEAAWAAAERISEAQVAQLRDLVGRGQAAATDLGRVWSANQSLHGAIDAVAPNRWRDEYTARLRAFIYRLRRIHPQAGDRLVAIRREHVELVDALEAHDGVRAAALARSHCLGSRDEMLARMGAGNDR